MVRASAGDAESLARLHVVFGEAFSQSSVPYTAETLRAKADERLRAMGARPPLEVVVDEKARVFPEIAIVEARLLLARLHGYENWEKFHGERRFGIRGSGHTHVIEVCFRNHHIQDRLER